MEPEATRTAATADAITNEDPEATSTKKSKKQRINKAKGSALELSREPGSARGAAPIDAVTGTDSEANSAKLSKKPPLRNLNKVKGVKKTENCDYFVDVIRDDAVLKNKESFEWQCWVGGSCGDRKEGICGVLILGGDLIVDVIL